MPNSPRESFFVGVDVGTGSARAGVFDKNGNMKGSAAAPIQLWKPATDYVEQSSDDIWSRCCEVVRTAVAKAGLLRTPLQDWDSMRPVPLLRWTMTANPSQ